MRDRLTKALPPVLSFAAVLLVWQGMVWVFRPPPFLLPGIDRVAERLKRLNWHRATYIEEVLDKIEPCFQVDADFRAPGGEVNVYSESLIRALPPPLVTLQNR